MTSQPPPYLTNNATVVNGYYQNGPPHSEAKVPSSDYNVAPLQANYAPMQPQAGISMSPKSLFPPQFGIYHASGSVSNMKIALTAESPTIFYISTHTAWSSQPSVVLHGNGYESSQPIATADFRAFSSTIDILLFGNTPSKLERVGAFSSVTAFTFPVPQANGQIVEEAFEWKRSSGPEVQSLQGSTHGMKCVRAGTGEVVAAWAKPNSGTRKKGKMMLLPSPNMLSVDREKFETLIVISMLSIMEKTKRNKRGVGAATVAGATAG